MRAPHWLPLVALALLTACATAAGSMRFENRAPVWRVADRAPIPKPEEREHVTTDLFVPLFRGPILDGLGFPGFERAHNINAIGEVPNSSWFTNRIGVRDLTAEEVARGPGQGPPPTLPLTVLRGKSEGAAPGFLVEDAEGRTYLLKFDLTFAPEVESAADAIACRLLWALGYNVPEDSIVDLRREDLHLGDDAVREGAEGEEEPLLDSHVDEILERVAEPERGDDSVPRWRGLLSRFVEGEPIGGYPMKGTRDDDPNDRVDHEHRRDLRAHGVFFAWLDHTDTKEANSLDTWIPTRPDAELGYVKHYLVDFGKALGASGVDGHRPHAGWSHQWEYGYAAASLVTFGLWVRPWENREPSGLRGVGRFSVEHYEPDRWRPLRLWFPMRRMDRFDAFWASKVLMRFEREHIEAAVAQGKLSDSAASQLMVEVLLGRQRKTARHWFQGVAPLDGFRVEPDGQGTFRVCATDLWHHYGFERTGDEPSRYRLRSYDWEGEALGWVREPAADERGRLCAEGLEPGSEAEEYTVVRFDVSRGDDELPPAMLHLARDPIGGELRVIGLHRM